MQRSASTPSRPSRTARLSRLAGWTGSTLALALALTACDRPDDSGTASQQSGDSGSTAGERVDRMSDQAASGAREMGRDVSEGARDAATSTSNMAKDVSITAEIKTQLARDDKLSATDINVDTSNGQVVLRGNAPDAASRERAASLARSISGVTGVDNQLTVKQNP